MKKILAFILALIFAFSLTGAALAEEMSDEDIIQAVVERFLLLTQVPRPSHHEERISEFLYNWATDRGFEAVRDEAGNVIFDVPAMAGYEDLPLVVLQAHMDMVCVAAEGVAFDPLNDPIHAIVTDETITADGTSLGADDGIGVALCMCVADGLIVHGPIRIIFTVDEEDGMEGIFALDAKYVADAHYLINLDAEQSNAIIASTASGVLLTYTGDIETVPVSGFDTAVTVSVKGLLGGHSGLDIDKGHVNATINLAGLILALRSEGIEFAVADITGGSVSNAIPSASSAVLVIYGADLDKLNAVCAAWQADMRLEYQQTDPDLTVTVQETDMPGVVMTDRSLNDVLGFITHVPNGVNSMSPDIIGLVESSSNLGQFRADADGLFAVTYVRSSDIEKQETLAGILEGLAAARGWTVTRAKSADPWKFNPDSRLLALAAELYFDLNGEEPEIQTLHAGLECGTFAVLNPDLDMIAMGPDLHDVHSPKETCVLSGIPKSFRLLQRLLLSVEE